MSVLSRLAKGLLPSRVYRFLLLRILRVQHRHVDLKAHPSRVFLERDILPWLASRYERVLFVGVAPYTYDYARLFRRGPAHYTTIDPAAAARIWGARAHIVAPLGDISRHRPDGFFDCIVFNGVFGYGIDTYEGQRDAIGHLHDALAPGGLLVVGWNVHLMPDLEADGSFAPYFAAAQGLPWPHRLRFGPPETHVYDFYERRPAQ